jgi:hypothetical protein
MVAIAIMTSHSLNTTQTPMEQVSGVFTQGERKHDINVTTLQLVPTFRIHEAISPVAHIFIAYVLIFTLYLTTTLTIVG